MTLPHRVLLVEGRKPATERLAPMLEPEFDLCTARTRREALARIKETNPPVIVLDAPSLRFSRRRFCSTLEEEGIDSAVLLLYDDNPTPDHVNARAYLRYPFSPQKLINRISWLLPTPEGEVLRRGELTLNLKRRSVTKGDREQHLTPKQAHLLELFMRHPGEVLTRELLMKQVWETDYVDDTRTLDVHIHWVRDAIEEDTRSPQYLHTVRGVGYRFSVPNLAE